MKIVVVAHGNIPAQTANSIQLMKMAQAFSGLGHKTIVFVPGKDPGLPWRKLSRHYGLKRRFELRWLPSHPWLRRYDFAHAAVTAAQTWGADLVYTRLPQAAALSARRGVPTVFELHGLPTGTMGPWRTRRFLDAQGANLLVTITKALARELKKRFRFPKRENLLLVAADGVDIERYANLPTPKSARKRLGLGEAFTAGYTGHLYAGRGIELILSVARKLPKIQFLFVGGTAEDVERRKRQAEDLDNVHFTGFVPNSELPFYQAACDVFLMPHGRKGVAGSSGGDIASYASPLKMFEYLACGRPLLASDLPVFREVLNESNAVLLPSRDVAAWAAALRSLQRSPRRRAALARAGRRTAAQHTWELRAQKILDSCL
ncbi:MAG: glycosyltransferase family 4 protein [Anaerolineales bacterium]